jgi:hypothetical protein
VSSASGWLLSRKAARQPWGLDPVGQLTGADERGRKDDLAGEQAVGGGRSEQREEGGVMKPECGESSGSCQEMAKSRWGHSPPNSCWCRAARAFFWACYTVIGRISKCAAAGLAGRASPSRTVSRIAVACTAGSSSTSCSRAGSVMDGASDGSAAGSGKDQGPAGHPGQILEHQQLEQTPWQLVAYIEAAFISVVAGVATALRDDRAHYFKSPIHVLKADNWACSLRPARPSKRRSSGRACSSHDSLAM